jgi:hypothetical protein
MAMPPSLISNSSIREDGGSASQTTPPTVEKTKEIKRELGVESAGIRKHGWDKGIPSKEERMEALRRKDEEARRKNEEAKENLRKFIDDKVIAAKQAIAGA